jgi:uncharacterized protein YukE
MAEKFMMNPDEARKVYAYVRDLSSRMKELTSTTEAQVGPVISSACAIQEGDTQSLTNDFNHLMQVANANAKVLDDLAERVKQALDAFVKSDEELV